MPILANESIVRVIRSSTRRAGSGFRPRPERSPGVKCTKPKRQPDGGRRQMPQAGGAAQIGRYTRFAPRSETLAATPTGETRRSGRTGRIIPFTQVLSRGISRLASQAPAGTTRQRIRPRGGRSVCRSWDCGWAARTHGVRRRGRPGGFLVRHKHRNCEPMYVPAFGTPPMGMGFDEASPGGNLLRAGGTGSGPHRCGRCSPTGGDSRPAGCPGSGRGA